MHRAAANSYLSLMTAIAFLGTGLLGSGFVEAACQRGDSVTVWNRTIEKARALTAFGATVADTPADAVRGFWVRVAVGDGQPQRRDAPAGRRRLVCEPRLRHRRG